MNTKTLGTRLLPIREVAKIIGLNPITLRAWERRYGLIEPIRTESGHRLYSPEHIEMLQEAIKLTEQGIPISQIKALLPNPKPHGQSETAICSRNSRPGHNCRIWTGSMHYSTAYWPIFRTIFGRKRWSTPI